MKTKYQPSRWLEDPVNQEYATKLTLTGAFLSIFAAFVSKLSFWTHNRSSRRPAGSPAFQFKPFDLWMLALATLRLGRMVSFDRVMEPLRGPVTRTVPDQTGAGDTVEPRGHGVRNSLGQLISCPICAGTWIAAALVYLLHAIPNPTRIFLAIFSTTGLAEILNALTESLSWSGQANRTSAGARLRYIKSQQSPEKKSSNGEANESYNHNIFPTGGTYYVRPDHEEHYRQGRR